jgi:antitoxin component YwqK of YwqJK toxin-antitoxin module
MQRVPASSIEYPGDGLSYLDGRPFTGVAYTLGADGAERSQTEYRQGLRWGNTTERYDSGQPMVESVFHKGVLHGRAREGHPNGQLAEDGEHEYGIALWERTWDENGSLEDDFVRAEYDQDHQTLLQYRALYGTGRTHAADDSPD